MIFPFNFIFPFDYSNSDDSKKKDRSVGLGDSPLVLLMATNVLLTSHNSFTHQISHPGKVSNRNVVMTIAAWTVSLPRVSGTISGLLSLMHKPEN